MNAKYTEAMADVVESIERYPLWSYLAWTDIRIRYIGSALGPFWITLSMVLFIGTLSLVYGRLLHQPLHTYIPFLSCGLMLWIYISGLVIDSCEMFHGSREYIHAIKLPYLIYLMRMVSRNLLILAHNSVVLVAVAVLFNQWPNWNTLFFIPGLVLVTMNLSAIALFIGLVSTRYRDIPPIVTSMVQIVFFVSPITWMPKLIGMQSKIIMLNPITHYMELTRSPLLGQAPQLESWLFVGGFTLFSTVLAFWAFSQKRSHIPFWL